MINAVKIPKTCDAALHVDRGRRERQHFRNARTGPPERKAEQAYLQRRAKSRLDKAPALAGVEIFPVTGWTEEAMAVAGLPVLCEPRLKQNSRFCFRAGRYSPNCNEFAGCHADAM